MHAYFVLGASRVRQVSMYVLPVILQPTRACGQSRSQEDVKIDIDKLHGTIRFESKILHNALGTTTQRESRSDRSSRTARRTPSSTKGPPKTLENQPATQTRYRRTPSHQQLRHASNVSATMLSKIRSTSMISVTKPWTSCAPVRPRTRHRASRSRQRRHSSQRGRRSKDAACDTQPGKCQAFDP